MNHRDRPLYGAVTYLPIGEIEKSLVQPRKTFDEAALRELADSIAACGILNPLTVRRKGEVWELVAGERRLRAAKRAGLSEVPCIVLNADMETASVLALVENLQREDLDFIEEAQAIQRLMQLFGMRQETAAKKLGKSQSAIANKLRILKLPEDVLVQLRQAGLTERHARALLRLPTAQAQREALAVVCARGLNVAGTERYIEGVLARPDVQPKPRRRTFLLKDVRVLLNSIEHDLDLLRQGGIDADLHTQEAEDALVVTIRIPKSDAKALKKAL